MKLGFLTLPFASLLLLASSPARAQRLPSSAPPPLVPLAAPRSTIDPAAAEAQQPRTEPRSIPAVVAGSLLISGGIAVHLVGIWMVVDTVAAKCEEEPCHTGVSGKWGLTLGGLGALAVGLPLLIWGMRDVPLRTGSLPAWVGAPGGTGWRWQF